MATWVGIQQCRKNKIPESISQDISKNLMKLQTWNSLKTKFLHKNSFYYLINFTKQINFYVELIFYFIFEYVFGNKYIIKLEVNS